MARRSPPAKMLAQIGAFALPGLLPDYIARWNLSKTEAKRGANRGCELCLENSALPDVAGQENGGGGTD
jgi:hypothetical protein